MAKKTARFEGTKEEIMGVIEKTGLSLRELADRLGLENHESIYNWNHLGYIPASKYRKILEIIEEGEGKEEAAAAQLKATSKGLGELTLDELIKEIESRGWKVDLRRQ